MTGFKDKTWVNNNPPQLEDDDLNGFKNEFNNTYITSGQTPSNADLQQTAKAMSIYTAGSDYYIDSGAADVYVLSASSSFVAPIAYFTGMRVRFFPINNNIGASTINVAGLGVKNIKLRSTEDPQAGMISSFKLLELVYDGTNFVFSNYITGRTVVGEITLPVLQSEIFTDAINERSFLWETNNVGKLQFNPALLTSNKVFLRIYIDGSSGAPGNFSIRFVTFPGALVVYESANVTIGNASSNEVSIIDFDMSTGITPIDFTTTILNGINAEAGGTQWEMQISTDNGGSGGFRLRSASIIVTDV